MLPRPQLTDRTDHHIAAMSQPQCSSRDFDERMLLFADLSYRYPCLAEGHALQASVRVCAAQCLRRFASEARAPPQPLARQQFSLRPKQQPCRHTITATRHHHHHHRVRTLTARAIPPPPAAHFACPYYKVNPSRHAACVWTDALPSVHSVKQHVIVHHHAPIACPVCAAQFPSAVARDNHVRARACVRREPLSGELEGATEAQVDWLMRRDEPGASSVAPGRRKRRRRKVSGDGDDDDEESWFRMWEVLFPGVPRPKTGYLAKPAEMGAVALRRFWRRVGPQVVKDLLRFEGGGADRDTREAVAGSVLGEMVEQAGLAGALRC